MAKNNARPAEESGAFEAERKFDRSGPSRLRDQRKAARVKDKPEESRLPTPPPDPQCPPVVLVRDHRSGVTSRGPEEEEEDLAAYLGELGASPFEGHSFDYDTTPNSATSAMGGDATPFTEEAFEHLDRLCTLTEQILELRTRSSEYFRRVRGLERAKVQRNANRRLEIALANGEELYHDFVDEDTGFAESLLDAMLSNSRDAASSTPRRNERSSVRSSALSRQRSRSLALTEQNLGSRLVEQIGEIDKNAERNVDRNGGPKISKWTRVKAAFKWERACTNDLADIAESDTPATTSLTPTTRYLRIPDANIAGSWSTGSALSPCTSEVSSPSTPIGRVSSTSSSTDDVFDDSRKNIVNYPERQSPFVKDDKKKDDPDRYGRALDRDTSVTESVDSIESPNEGNRGKPLIRIISDTDAPSGSGKDPEMSPKRPTPTLTITIPSNEEEIRSLSSPESISPLPSSAQDSGGSSPQRPRMRQDILSLKEFKRQYSTIEEAIMPAPKIQQQDSKWNKVRRAFLTNATFSVPPSPIKVIAAQSFMNDDRRRARSLSESVEDLGKTVAGINNNGNHYREARRDYQALREKFGAEFHRKLIEWERLKGPQNIRNGLPLNEECLAPEFRKKLQDWKRAKKGRRSSVAIEQQRVSRRRLTDWQLWRSSSSKPESRCYGKNQSSIGSRGSCASIGSAGSFSSDGKQHLCEDFIKRMEAWRRMSEASCRSGERPKSPMTNRVTSDIDETEFLALEKLLLLFGQRTKKELRESDARQLNDCFDGDSRFMAASRGVNCGNEVLIRTSVGSYRFEGISREFTRKLYDWEKYRGISPRSSTFRLLGPGYTPFAQDSNEVALSEPSKNHAYHWTLKRSKSDGSVFEGSLRDESFTLRRSASLQSLTSAGKLEDDNRIDILPISNNSQGIKDPEDTAIEDSEPEAMIVDIEDVIEETASPLAGVQPHQTPVYSVAASETTSIAVPLGTVTSSHEPSPVFLVKTEDDEDCERWNIAKIGQACSSENSPSPEYFPVSEDWCGRTSLDDDKSNWESSWCKESREDDDTGRTEKARRSIPDCGDSVKSDRSIGWNRDIWDKSGDEANRDSMILESPSTSICENKSDTRKEDFLESDNVGSVHFKSLEISPMASNAEELMDPPRTCKGMDETCKEKPEDLADESSNNERTSDAKNLRDDEDDEKTKRGDIILSAEFCAYQLTKTVPSSVCPDSKETSSKLLNLNLDNKVTSECHGVDSESEASAHYESCGSPELQTDADRHYEILMFKTDMCGNTMDNRLYEPVDYHKIHSSSSDRSNYIKDISSLSRVPETKKSNLLETPRSLFIDSTIQTIPVTVSRNNEMRSLEKILINEETLNKIIVPTACTESGTKSTERIRNHFRKANRQNDIAAVNNYASKKIIRDHQVECVKKDGSSTRNVFVKTKRMIFSPFRRSEDRPSSRKQSDSSVDDRLPHLSKSKNKSRSASPKLGRQDALLRVSLSLPWPLRSTSKESEILSEIIRSRRSSESKTEDAIMIQEKNSLCKENNVNNKRLNGESSNKDPPYIDEDQEEIQSDTELATMNVCSIGNTSARISKQLEKSKIAMLERDPDACRMRGKLKYNQTHDDGERDKVKCSQVQFEGKCDVERNQKREERWQEKQDEAKQQNENHSRCDVVSSDLMHKLKILSDAAAKREGRTMIAESSVINSLESRSSRIRRAKENFLSRRGGPFCRSVMDSMDATSNPEDPWRRMSTTQISAREISKLNETVTASSSQESRYARNHTETTMLTVENETVSLGEEKIDVRTDSLVKSASAGMINVDPDTFDRLVTVDRGCESLPRAIAKRRDSSSPLAKIVGKLKLSRLIRARNVDSGNMSTITTLCRQSLLIDMRNDPRNQTNEQGIEDPVEDDTDEHSDESCKTIHE
ncbi:PREDICTED: uncharacterized protein LOC108689971 isoform X1 [Atta colombica]|uniref:uncharacterized protein LOC108689971 isoform X1 n=1 Tax=Atta colombica TaxID=520822 RepID=UPI00084C495A|nr:PREDICTED: uncharacterized protein LOC108689971 isoform X1 [Atta colombica]XP_018052482.1 PREDICTED: uncharacterized protein LOC108689971 isoform X1 [Atta colombica]XP_018052484.1 PREDICTED: uncharacterized protein LOC108689971 isoform X1 [Atta colombica]